MAKNLVIVESPAKAKTIEKFLGKDFEVLSSYGHIRDLKKKDFSVDIEHNYKPIYEIPADKKKLVETLKQEADKADMVWLASDEDREGEAIAWHLFEVLKLKPEKTKRIVFHEITKDAILHAIENPRDIDLNRVDAQQARRVLDRIVGFELSPVLWKKVKPALSAGRVQSVAVRLIVEREREISAFKPEAAYRVIGEFLLPGGELLKAELSQRLKTEDEAKALLEACKTAQFSIGDVTVKPAKKSPAAPFTTSTLQQEAARKLGFSVAQTMMVAQRLYEAGHITYMRTDSVNLSSLAINTTKDEIVKLIWKRTIASQMSDAELEKTTATIAVSGRKEHFVAVGEVLKFDGFLKVYMESTDDEGDTEGNDKMLPALAKGDVLTLSSVTATERFSQAPARYTEASLVRKLEELGIGRPSTYAPTISTIQQREYVEKGDRKGTERKYRMLTLHDGKIESGEKTELTGADKGKLLPTDIGVVVNDFLTEYFPDILNYNFTANVEQQFDDIAEGKTVWNDEIDHFYKLFHPVVESALALRLEHKVGERVLGTDPKSGRPVSVKIGRFGPLVQIGTPEDTEKPLFASLLKGQSMSTITLEEALKLFDLPRTLGDFEGKTVVVGIGRFGPYIRHDGKYVSLPKEFTPQGVSLEDAIMLIQQKREQESQRFIKKFDEDDELELLNGRFGPYIAYKKKNYKLPKGSEPASLTFADCMKIVEDADKAPAKKKPARKKTTK